MPTLSSLRLFLSILACFLSCGSPAPAQVAKAAPAGEKAELQFVVVLSRHGVRSPLGNADLLNKYSAAPWPKWDVPPSYLTPHGYALMKLFSAWDRARFSRKGLFAPLGCEDAMFVTILADSDERTRETGKALAEGIFPDCPIEVHAKAEGTADPLYTIAGGLHPGDGVFAAAAIAGRIGGDPNRLTEAFRPQLAALDNVLAGCGHAAPTETKRTSIFDVPAVLAQAPTIGRAILAR